MKSLETIFNEYHDLLKTHPDFRGFATEDARYIFYSGAMLLVNELISEGLIHESLKETIIDALPRKHEIL